MIPVKETQQKYKSSWLELKYCKPEIGKIIKLPVLSGSMSPLIKPGDIISIKCISGSDCSSGDIIVFRNGNGLTAHRLLFSLKFPLKSYFYQKGDANPFGGLIDSNLFVGIVIKSEDNSGNILSFNELDDKERFRKVACEQLIKDIFERFFYIPRIFTPKFIKNLKKRLMAR